MLSVGKSHLKKYKLLWKKLRLKRALDKKLLDHQLTGEWRGFRELHIEPDWLLIYEITSDKKTVIFTRTGTHSDLF